MINIPSHLLQVPVAPQMNMADALRQQVGSLSQYVQQQQAKQQMFQQMIDKARIEQRMKQADPMNRVIRIAQVADARNKAYEAGADTTQFDSMLKALLGGQTNVTPQSNQPQQVNVPTSNSINLPIKPNLGGQSTVRPKMTISDNTSLNNFRKFQPSQEDTGQAKFIPKGLDQFGRVTGYERDPVEENWKKTSAKNKQTLWESYQGVEGLLQNTVSVWKAASQELQDNGIPKGLTSKMMTNVADIFELQGYPNAKAYAGQVIETAMSLSKIITGGSRIIRSVINQLIKTLPTMTGIEEDMEAKVGQSLRNSFTRAIGRALTKEEQTYIDNRLDNVLSVRPAAGRVSAPSFKVFQVNGEDYKIPIDKVLDFINDPEFKSAEIYDITGQVK